MARSDTITLLPLDTYPRLMAIQPCAFNQVYNPTNAYPTECNQVWQQSAWVGASERLVGRDEVATAMATAEELMAEALRFTVAPTFVAADERAWPLPKRGRQIRAPSIQLRWGQFIGAGRENIDTAILLNAPVVYSDRDGDGVPDTATITLSAAQLAAAGANQYEIAVYYPSVYLDWAIYPRDESWRIRPFRIVRNPTTGNVTLTGDRCQFVRPDLWEDDAPVDQSDAASFVTSVDVYRRYLDTSQQAQLVYVTEGPLDCLYPPCNEQCQAACVVIGADDDRRNGIVKTLAATHSAGDWTYQNYLDNQYPDHVRVWYLAGAWKRLNNWMEADLLGKNHPAMAEAIVQLANTLLPEAPCTCNKTQTRWMRDREEQDINTLDVALAASAFGSTMRGAVFAWSVVKRLNPLAGAGSL